MSSRSTALIHLREKVFTRGEPALVNYYEDSRDGGGKINTIMAVGIKNGKGKDCFRIVTLGQYEIVWGVTDVLPDVANLIHDELYLYKDSRGQWFYVSAPDGKTRTIEPILPLPQVYLNIEDNGFYVSGEDRQVRSIFDVYTKAEIDSLLNTISDGEFTSLSALEKKLDDAYTAIQEVIQQNEELVEVIEGMQESISAVTAFTERVDEIEKKVESLEVVDEETSNIAGTFSSVTLAEGNLDDSPVVINKDTVITTDNIDEFMVEGAEPIPIETLNNEVFNK